MKRIQFFIRTLIDVIPSLWTATRYVNYDLALFYCNDADSWKKYLALKEKIGQIVEPTYKVKVEKGHIHTKLIV